MKQTFIAIIMIISFVAIAQSTKSKIPFISVIGKTGGEIKISDIKIINTIDLQNSSDSTWYINSFKLVIGTPTQLWLEEYSSSNKLTENMKSILSKCTVDSKIIIENITCANGKDTLRLPSLIFTVKK
jgi:hypothetical protein